MKWLNIKNFSRLTILSLTILSFPYMASAEKKPITVRWIAPQTNQDGSVLKDLAGFKIYYGNTSRQYTNVLDVGMVTYYQFSSLSQNKTYYFSVTSYNSKGIESEHSMEVKKQIPSSAASMSIIKNLQIKRIR